MYVILMVKLRSSPDDLYDTQSATFRRGDRLDLEALVGLSQNFDPFTSVPLPTVEAGSQNEVYIPILNTVSSFAPSRAHVPALRQRKW